MKLKVIQYYTPNCTYAVTSEEINRAYCEKYNIDYFSETDKTKILQGCKNRAVQWYKIKFLKEQISKTDSDYVIFMDADAVFVNLEKDVRAIISLYSEKELIISEDFGPDIVNTGVMIFKNTSWSIDFLDRVWEAGDKVSRGKYRTEIWHEQTIVSAFIHINKNDKDKTVILFPSQDDSINDNLLRNGHTFIYHDLSKRRIEEIKKINSGNYDVITELNLSCESDRQVSHKYGSYYNEYIRTYIEKNSSASILDIGGDKGVIFDILTRYYPEIEYYNFTEDTYKKDNNKINVIKIDRIDESSIDLFLSTLDRQYDLIIADFRHQCLYRDLLFLKFFPKVNSNGLFVIEDIQTDHEINVPEKNSLYGWGDPSKKSMTQLIKEFNVSKTFNSDYYDFGQLNEHILKAEIFRTESGSELGLIFKK